MRLLICLCLGFGGGTTILAQDQVLLRIQPLDFQDDTISETLVHEIKQVETSGEYLVIRSENAHLIQIDRQGRFVGSVGPVYSGTNHQSQSIAAFQTHQDRIVLVNPLSDIFVFEGQTLVNHIESVHYRGQFSFPYLNANSFAFDGTRFVLSARPKQGLLAVAHHVDNTLLHKITDPDPLPEAITSMGNGMAGTFWTTDGTHWFALYKFQPILLIYDQELRLIGRFEITGDEIGASQELLDQQQKRLDRRIPRPLFSDFKAHGGSLFAMSGPALYQIDPKTGATIRIFRFMGTGPDFEAFPPGQWLTIPFFAIFADGTMVLAHPAQLWNHDLWVANLSQHGF